MESSAAEINGIKKGFPLKKSKLIPLAPFLGNGLIRVWGRIGRAFFPYGQRYQVVISGKHLFTSLVVFYFHEKTSTLGESSL